MKRHLFVLGLLAAAAMMIQAQGKAPYAPFTAEQARIGKELSAKAQEVRKGITNNSDPAEPFKIIGNLYFVGDLNQPMLERAARRQDADDRIVWQQADALHLPFEGNSFDAVCCQFGVMFFPTESPGIGKRFASSTRRSFSVQCVGSH